MQPGYRQALPLAVLLSGLLVGFGLLAAAGLSVHAAEWPSNAYVLRVDGLACPYCGYGIEKQFTRQAGVQGTEIDIDKGVVVVSVETGTRFSDEELKQIVHDSGFELGDILHHPQGE